MLRFFLRKIVIAALAGLALSVVVPAQSRNKQASHGTRISRFYIAEPDSSPGYETGPLHIIYSDGTQIVQQLPPLKKSTEKEIIFNAVGFSDVQLAEDGRTLGWAVDVENCCTSYSIPWSVDLFRSGRILHSFYSGQMVWSWMFVQGGKHVAVMYGPVHGSQVGEYRLYDVKTGQLISQQWGDEALKHDAPSWAKQLQGRARARAQGK